VLVRNRHEHDDYRKHTRRQDISIRFADRVQNDLVSYKTPVDEEEHRIPVVLLHVRAGRKEMYLYSRPAESLLMFDELIEQVLPENLKETISKTVGRRRRQYFESTALQKEMNLRKSQRVVRAKSRNLAQFVRLGT